MIIKIKKLNKQAKLPKYAHSGDAGLDLYSLENYLLKPGEHRIFFLGFALEFPQNYVALVKDKGSLAKKGIHTMAGVYDSEYRGEYNVFLINLSKRLYKIEIGDKIAQLIILPIAKAKLKQVKKLSSTSRKQGRFGSTGRK